MAENIKTFLLTQRAASIAAALASANVPAPLAQQSSSLVAVKKKENLLPRTYYEFNLASTTLKSPVDEEIRTGTAAEEAVEGEEEDPVPLTVMKSKQVIQ